MFKNITVLGSGLMGSAIAAHFANAGCNVNLLDIVDNNNKNRNSISDKAIKKLLKIKPSPLTIKSNINLIKSGNLEDDLDKINNSEWVIEVIIENLNIKKELYQKIDNIMKNDLIISSNTSTIPISLLTEGLSDKFKKNFLVTHFFNPPRYLKLLEIVKSNYLDDITYDKVKNFCDINLGKTVIETKDTPGFIGNRIGIFWIERAVVQAIKYGLSVEETDSIIMNVFNVPKTGVFGLIDVVGLDLIPPVVNSLLKNIPENDFYKTIHQSPEIFKKMIDKKMFGRKAEGGFYKLVKENNKMTKHSLNLQTLEYSKSIKYKIENTKLIKNNLKEFLINENKISNYAFEVLSDVIYYVLEIAEEISLDIISIDQAMKNGFGWKFGPFEIIDKIGISFLKEHYTKSKNKIPKLLEDIKDNNFYKIESNKLFYFDFNSNNYESLNRPKGVLLLSDFKKTNKALKRIPTASLWNIGDGVIVFELHSKSNSIDMATMSFLD